MTTSPPRERTWVNPANLPPPKREQREQRVQRSDDIDELAAAYALAVVDDLMRELEAAANPRKPESPAKQSAPTEPSQAPPVSSS